MTLNVCYIVSDVTDDWFRLSVQSVLPIADRFVFVIDRPSNITWEVIELAQLSKPVVILHNRYAHESKTADGQQRTVYLDWLKRNALGEWALILDTDEVLSNNYQDLLPYLIVPSCFDIRMRHVFWTLSTEDATLPEHYVPKRLFYVKAGLAYPFVEHPILQGHDSIGRIPDVHIWHFGPTRGILEEVKKFKNQCAKSNIHSPQQLAQWHNWHVLGHLPAKRFDIMQLPKIVREHCCIQEDKNVQE